MKAYEFKYSPEIKQAFLDKIEDEDSKIVERSRLSKIDTYEYNIEKEILQWNRADLEDFLYFVNSMNVLSLNAYMMTMRRYVEFRELVFREENEDTGIANPIHITINGFSCAYKNLEKYLNIRKFQQVLLTRSEYIDMIKDERMPVAFRTTFVLLFTGVAKQSEDVFGVRKDEINYETSEIRGIKLDNTEMKIVKEFIQLQETSDQIGYSYESKEILMTAKTSPSFKRWYTVNTKSKYIYHQDMLRYVRSDERVYDYRNRVNRIEVPLSYKEGIFKKALRNAFNDIGKPDFKLKGFIKSGAYYRLYLKLGSERSQYDITTRKTCNEYMEGYATYNRTEMNYILDKMEQESF